MRFNRLSLGLSQFFQLPINVVLAKTLPYFCLRLYIYMLGFMYLSLKRDDLLKIIIAFNYVMRPNLSSGPFFWGLLKTLLGVFDHYYEKLIMAHRPVAEMARFLDSRLDIRNQDVLDEMAASGKGGILVTGHFGAVEFLPMSLAMKGYKIAMIVRFKTSKLKEELMERARIYDVEVIDADEGNVVLKALNAIKGGRFLVTECDEFSKWRPHKDRFVEVFGTPVPRDKTLDFFYNRTRVPAALVLMKRTGTGVTMCVEPLADGSSGISLASVAWNRLEGYILSHPNQWYQWKDAVIPLRRSIEKGRRTDEAEGRPGVQGKDPFLFPDLA